jgi:hypothetical protein
MRYAHHSVFSQLASHQLNESFAADTSLGNLTVNLQSYYGFPKTFQNILNSHNEFYNFLSKFHPILALARSLSPHQQTAILLSSSTACFFHELKENKSAFATGEGDRAVARRQTILSH